MSAVVVADGRRPFTATPLDGTAERLVAALVDIGCRTELRAFPRLDSSAAGARTAFGLSLLREDEAALLIALRTPAPLVLADRRTWWAWDLLASCDDLALTTSTLDDRSTLIATSAAGRDRLQALGLRPLVLRVPAPDPADAPGADGAVVVDLASASERAIATTLDCARRLGHHLLLEDRSLSGAFRQRVRGLPGADGVRWASDLSEPAAHLGAGALVLGREADLEGSAAITAAAAGRPVAGPDSGPSAEIGLVAPGLRIDPEDADDVGSVLAALAAGGTAVTAAGDRARRQVETNLPSWPEAVAVLLSSMAGSRDSSLIRSRIGAA